MTRQLRLRRRFRELIAKVFGKQNVSKTLKSISHLSRKFAAYCHKTQLNFDWTIEPSPEWFDHYCDQFYNFKVSQNPLWVERGAFGLLAIKEGACVLELCSGDGFNSHHFYSIRAKSIIAIDFDKEAISHALKYNQAKNIQFNLCDIRTEMPEGIFDNIIWDAAIEHFTEEEIDSVLKNIKLRLTPSGILTGYTIVESIHGKSLSHHEREFKSKEDLMSFFKPHFKNVKVFETIYPSRHNLYFYASDDTLPFDKEWQSIVIK
jgi:2-polyprenyl-3-methyl-5-hydroxy-6-metoxy-1,4-benzoquinol methylase